MTLPQPGIFALGTRSHHHLEFELHADAEVRSVRAALASLSAPHVTGGATNLVLGFGADLWRRLSPRGHAVPDLVPFPEIEGAGGHRAPSTQHDVWAWVHGSGTDGVLDTARAIVSAMSPLSELAVDAQCFIYHDSRDLTGFVDGTANPTPTEAPKVACIPLGRPGEGGSHVITQRWLHNLAAFHELDVADQERVFGRSKLDSVELPSGSKPSDSHIALVEIHDAAGDELPIYRRSTPWGTGSAQGLYFLAFSAVRERFELMLSNMFGGSDGRAHDRLLDFTTPVTGSYYFAPSLDELLALGVGDD